MAKSSNEYMREYMRQYRAKARERGEIIASDDLDKHNARLAERREAGESRIDDPLKKHAQNLVSAAIRRGRMEPAPYCEVCGSPAKTQAHHDDYSKPLEVRWLCRLCHEDEHRTS